MPSTKDPIKIEKVKKRMSLRMSGENNPMYNKHHTEESKLKISIAAKQRPPISEETRKKLSEATKGENNPNYGKHPSDETKLKISIGVKNNRPPISDEQRKKMSDKQKGIKNSNYGNPQGLSFSGHNHTEESRKKMSESHKGVPMPIETRIKISNSTKGANGNHFGIPIPDNVKQKISDKLKGRKLTDETCKRMSAAHKDKIIPDDQRERMYESQIGGFWYGNVRNDYTIRNILRMSQKYKTWRKIILERDEYKDVNTKKICKYPEVHHIISVIDLIKKYNIKTMRDAYDCEELWDVNNGVTMERKNHIRLHGYSYNTEEELKEMYENTDIE